MQIYCLSMLCVLLISYIFWKEHKIYAKAYIHCRWFMPYLYYFSLLTYTSIRNDFNIGWYACPLTVTQQVFLLTFPEYLNQHRFVVECCLGLYYSVLCFFDRWVYLCPLFCVVFFRSLSVLLSFLVIVLLFFSLVFSMHC